MDHVKTRDGALKPIMTVREVNCLRSHLEKSRFVIEYGTGGSTLLALGTGVEKLLSVDSDADWIERVRRIDAAGAAEREGRLHLLHIDIGTTRRFGYPVDTSRKTSWPDYPSRPWSVLSDPDMVLVDGRFRVASIMASVLRSSRSTMILAHDFWNRPAYHVTLPFLDWIESADTLGVFRRRGQFDTAAAATLFIESCNQPN